MCTNFRIIAEDASVVIGRTMEFGIDPGSQLTIFPRNFSFQGIGVDNTPGFTWKGMYGFVGMNILGMPLVSDGMNEKGLYVGDLYLPGFTTYQTVPSDEQAKAISPLDVAGYLLSQCETVEMAKEAIQKIYVWPQYIEQIKGVPPLHFILHDANGQSAVFEYVDGVLQIHDNPLGVATNAPTFDWHLINLRNYVNLSATTVPELKLDNGKLQQLGQGSGMLGLPGDATPPSRFVRATAFTQSAIKPKDSKEAVNVAFHIANNFDIPKGFSRANENGTVMYDFTFWTTLADLTGKNYYYRGYDNIKIYRVSLDTIDFSVQDIKKLDTSNADWYQQVS
jgi:choloylglycine hydrolase